MGVVIRPSLVALGIAIVAGLPGAKAHGQASQPQAIGPDRALMMVLQANPATAPYRFTAEMRGDRVLLGGRVPTKVVHDIAVRAVIDTGIRFVDNLVIDTAEAARGVQAGGMAMPYPDGPGAGFASFASPAPYGGGGGFNGVMFPPPLFGRWDDPFYGLEPPVISYPPGFGAVTMQRRMQDAALLAAAQQQQKARAGPQPQPAPGNNSNTEHFPVDVAIDPQGVATLRGEVPTMTDKIGVGRRVSQIDGVTQVRNELTVRDPSIFADPDANPNPNPNPGNAPPAAGPRVPPPPPVPAFGPAAAPADPPPAAKEPKPSPEGEGLAGRVRQAIARRPALESLKITVTTDGPTVRLRGALPSAYEAMLAYRAAQRTPGVGAIDDLLEFEVPQEGRPNPLLTKGRPEDIEPYLEAQIARQLGRSAHVDRVRLQADRLEVRGTVAKAADRPRAEAVLRSMALLRGFEVDSIIAAEGED